MLYSFSCQFRFLLVRASQRAGKCKSKNHWHGMMAPKLRALVSRTGHRLLLTPTSGLTTMPRGSIALFWPLQAPGNMQCIHEHASKSVTERITGMVIFSHTCFNWLMMNSWYLLVHRNTELSMALNLFPLSSHMFFISIIK